MMTFNQAKELFSKARNKVYKPLELNTRLIKLSEDCYGILLYNTVVVEIWESGMYKYKSGGWTTRTTLKRINKYGPCEVKQSKNKWYVIDSYYGWKNFEEGVRVYG